MGRFVAASVCATLLTLAFPATAAFAQSADAARYVNAQGIEVIQSRRTVAAQAPVTEAAKNVPRPPAAPAAVDAKLLIPAKEQAARDQDRLSILKAELKDETSAFETKLRILQAPAANGKLSADERQRIEEAMTRHQNNIRALNAEIARIR
jgi:hypothetical protein